MNDFFETLGLGIVAVILLLIFSALYGWIVMLLWNWLMPALFGLPTLTFLQAWGLKILMGLLVKSSVTTTKKSND